MRRRDLDPGTNRLFLSAERRAEWLIALLRLGISLSLGAVMTFSLVRAPVPLGETLQWHVIYTIGVMVTYFLLGLVAMTIISRRLFRSWMVWPSALGDCAFILAGTYFSVANSGLPGNYVSAFPTMWLIPIVLACGALRFNPALQGVMAAILVAGVLYILRLEGAADAARASDALVFLYQLPPNLMRATMIAIAATVLVVASVRIRKLIWQSILEAETRTTLTRFLPRELGTRLEEGQLDDLRTGALQPMVMMFIDIRGFTSQAEGMDPQETTDFLAAFRKHVTTRADRHGGIVDKFIGDGAMVVFDFAKDQGAVRAMEFGLGLIADLHDWNPDLRIGIGGHLGEVFVGVVGDESRLEYTVLGDAVNVAARLESATRGQGLVMLVSQDLCDAAGQDTAGWTMLPELALPGRKGTIAAVGLPR